MPDLGFVLDGKERWAVEFERTPKGHGPLEQILEGYREAQLEVCDEFTIEPEVFFEHGERVAVAVRQRAHGEASGVEVEIRIGHLWTVREGKIVRLEVFSARDDARKAALSERLACRRGAEPELTVATAPSGSSRKAQRLTPLTQVMRRAGAILSTYARSCSAHATASCRARSGSRGTCWSGAWTQALPIAILMWPAATFS